MLKSESTIDVRGVKKQSTIKNSKLHNFIKNIKEKETT